MVSHEAVVKMSSGAVLSEGLNGEGGAASKMVHSGSLTGSLCSLLAVGRILQFLAMWASPHGHLMYLHNMVSGFSQSE